MNKLNCIIISSIFNERFPSDLSIYKINSPRIYRSTLTQPHIVSLFLPHELLHPLFPVLRLYIYSRTALFTSYPFDMIVNRQYRFNKNNECRIQRYWNQNLSSICIISLWNHHINVQKNKCHYAIVKQPIISKNVPWRNELYLIFEEPRLPTSMGIRSPLSSPRHIVNVTKSMNDHSLCISPSEHDITDLIEK